MVLEIIFIVVAVAAVLAVIAIALMYNDLISTKNQIENAWAQIDVQLKKRYDLIPNLVETVKGYAKHEKSVFENVTKARAAMMKADTVAAKAKADNMLSSALKSIFAVAENYPKLEASENFKMLQEELSGIESKIAYARQFYNDSVLSFNNKIMTIPTNFIAGMLGFKPRDYFKVEEGEKGPVKVKF
jgi:LemA protein